MQLITIARRLRDDVGVLSFAPPVTHVYNPLDYAWRPHRKYLTQFGAVPKRGLMLGMNPGPFGMAQTGVPFGEVASVRDWLGINEKVDSPKDQHPKRPITGFNCTRGEVSGQRLWGWAAQRYRTPAQFHRHFFIWNYCPLVFMEESGRNRTPDKLTVDERQRLFDACDVALGRVIETLKPTYIIGIGRFATDRASALLKRDELKHRPVVVNAPHPSPASPAANRGWSPIFEQALDAAGVALD
ncbi:MAG: uracil-DNA glycosylase family protein [Pseudomonadota bacterium]